MVIQLEDFKVYITITELSNDACLLRCKPDQMLKSI